MLLCFNCFCLLFLYVYDDIYNILFNLFGEWKKLKMWWCDVDEKNNYVLKVK